MTFAFERTGPRPSQTTRRGRSASTTVHLTVNVWCARHIDWTSLDPLRRSPLGASFSSRWIETQFSSWRGSITTS